MLETAPQIRGYEVLAPISSGGMATLYLGRRQHPDGHARLVALKVVHADLADDEAFIKMFLDEALLCSRIHHPNVVQVEELGESGGSYFLAMEFVRGVSLSQLLRRLVEEGRRLSAPVAVAIAMGVAAGLHAAHEVIDDHGNSLGVVHRDVSPQNVLIDMDGYVKLIDFGIAKSATQSVQTQSGQLKGKFRYMSPEQASSEPIDRRTDVYALGVVLWEMLTGRRLIHGKTEVELLMAAQQPRVVPPSLFDRDLPPALDEVLMRALAKDKAQRFATAEEMRAALALALPAAREIGATALGGLMQELFGDDLMKHIGRFPDAEKWLGGRMGSEPPGDTSHVRELTVPRARVPRIEQPRRASRWRLPLMVAGGVVAMALAALIGFLLSRL